MKKNCWWKTNNLHLFIWEFAYVYMERFHYIYISTCEARISSINDMNRHGAIWYLVYHNSVIPGCWFWGLKVAKLKTWSCSKHPDSDGCCQFFAFYNIINKHLSESTSWINGNLFENLLGYYFEEEFQLPQLGRCFQKQPKAAKPLVGFAGIEFCWPWVIQVAGAQDCW